MNLVEEPWIPVLLGNGESGLVSLREAFLEGSEIADLAVRPHERVALMRLLVCVAQAALDGPADHEEWLECRERIPNAASEYLSRWRPAFELFGDGQRFLQVPDLAPPPGSEPDTSVTKLDLAMATGNNPTLFDNGGGAERRFEPGWIALALLTFQCFSPGGRIGVVQWAGKPTGNGSSAHAPCVSRSMLHAFLRGGDLGATIHLNSLHRELVEDLLPWGCPVWERWPKSAEATADVQNATETYLGRLVPLSRAIRLQTNVNSILNSEALVYPPQREPWATEVLRTDGKETKRSVVSASLEKASWRELASIAVKRTEAGGPLSLQNIPDEHAFDLWTGGLVADKAKLIGSVESVFHIPAAMARERGQRRYELGIRLAEDAVKAVQRAIFHYWSEYSRTAGKKAPKEGLREPVSRSRATAQTFFWTALEQHVPDLFAAIDAEDESWAETGWGKDVSRTARLAFEAACERGTSRQIRAFAKAQQILFWEGMNGRKTGRQRGEASNAISGEAAG